MNNGMTLLGTLYLAKLKVETVTLDGSFNEKVPALIREIFKIEFG